MHTRIHNSNSPHQPPSTYTRISTLVSLPLPLSPLHLAFAYPRTDSLIPITRTNANALYLSLLARRRETRKRHSLYTYAYTYPASSPSHNSIPAVFRQHSPPLCSVVEAEPRRRLIYAHGTITCRMGRACGRARAPRGTSGVVSSVTRYPQLVTGTSASDARDAARWRAASAGVEDGCRGVCSV